MFNVLYSENNLIIRIKYILYTHIHKSINYIGRLKLTEIWN